MKILYIRTVPWFNLKAGGSVGHTSGVINSLAKNVNLDVISNDKLHGVKQDIKIISPFFKFIPFLSELLHNIRLSFLLKNISQYDYIYQRHSAESFIGAYLSLKFNVPLILEFNSMEAWKLKNWGKKKNFLYDILNKFYRKNLKLPIVKKCENYSLKNATYIVVVSEVLKRNLINEGIPASKILINPNGVDPEIYYPEIKGLHIANKNNIKVKNIIGFIGTFGQWHGALIMAKAIVKFFELFPNRKNDTHFLLIGQGNQLKETKAIVNSTDAKNHTTFTGRIPQDDGPEYLAACNILLSPHVPNPDGTEFFGSPTKLFEYMAMGKAIVASDLEQIGDILSDKNNALMVEPNNEVELAEKINELISDSELQKKLGINARNHVLNNYTWDKHVERILNFIKK